MSDRLNKHNTVNGETCNGKELSHSKGLLKAITPVKI